jgi:glutamine synthetase
VNIVDTYIAPAALKEQTAAANAISALQSVGQGFDMSEQVSRLKLLSEAIAALLVRKKELVAHLTKVAAMPDEKGKAALLSTEGQKLMDEIRSHSDQLEEWVSDENWPLPKYREMLFLA